MISKEDAKTAFGVNALDTGDRTSKILLLRTASAIQSYLEETYKTEPWYEFPPSLVLVKDGKRRIITEFPNSVQVRCLDIIKSIVDQEQPEAFMVVFEGYTRLDNESESGYGQPHPLKKELLLFVIRSKDGSLNMSKSFIINRGKLGTTLTLLDDEGKDCKSPRWGETPHIG